MLQEIGPTNVTQNKEFSGKFYGELTPQLNETIRAFRYNPDKTRRSLVNLMGNYYSSNHEGPYRLQTYTAVRACSDLINGFATLKFGQIGPEQDFDGETKDSIRGLKDGSRFLAANLRRGDGGMQRGERMEAVLEVHTAKEAGEITLSQAGEAWRIYKNLIRMQMNDLAVDFNGGYLLMSSYDTIMTAATGVNREGDRIHEENQGWNENDVRGAVFATEMYREIFPIASTLFPLPERSKYL